MEAFLVCDLADRGAPGGSSPPSNQHVESDLCDSAWGSEC